MDRLVKALQPRGHAQHHKHAVPLYPVWANIPAPTALEAVLGMGWGEPVPSLTGAVMFQQAGLSQLAHSTQLL